MSTQNPLSKSSQNSSFTQLPMSTTTSVAQSATTSAASSSMSATPTTTRDQHQLNVKVMRLTRPSLAKRHFIHVDALDGREELKPFQEALKEINGEAAHDSDKFALSPILSISAQSGRVFLGETFSAYVSIHNVTADLACNDVALTAELQTPTRRLVLDTGAASNAANSSAEPNSTEIPPTKNRDHIITSEIKELGTHILVISLAYNVTTTSLLREKKVLKKYYKFNVLNPLSIKTKVNSIPNGECYLEALINNTSGDVLWIDTLNIDSDLFLVNDLSYVKEISEIDRENLNIGEASKNKSLMTTSVFNNSHIFQPNDTRQYLYHLTPKERFSVAARTTPSLGRLDITWHTSLGATGRLQTSQLPRKVPTLEPILLQLARVPSQITIEQPFTVSILFRNDLADGSYSVEGVKNKMSSILLSGDNQRRLGLVRIGEERVFEMTFLPLMTGTVKICGLRVIDEGSGTTVKEVDCLGEVFVQVDLDDKRNK